MPRTPVILLAFANDPQGSLYLRELAAEARQVRAALEPRERRGHYRLDLRPNITPAGFFSAFTDDRGHVALLHFGGHAGCEGLLMESGGPGAALAYAKALATYLEQHPGLKVAFLNGCSTRDHVRWLHVAGIAVVIATSRLIRSSAFSQRRRTSPDSFIGGRQDSARAVTA